MNFPFAEADRQKALSLPIGALIFSRGTYQVEVIDREESYWPFLQLADQGDFKDGFCSCLDAEVRQSCPHLAAAYLTVASTPPLHVRFYGSLWNALCRIAAKRSEYEALYEKQEGGFAIRGLSRALLASGESTEGKIEELFQERKLENEENSIKFSNLPEEELSLWRSGHPSHTLAYELSAWSDLAKMLFLAEAKEEAEITFDPPAKNLPQALIAHFSGLTIRFPIAHVDWEELIPSLALRKTPISMHAYIPLDIRSMHYDPHFQTLSIVAEETSAPEQSREGEIELNSYVYHPERGFYPAKIDPLLKKPQLDKRDIGRFLDRYHSLVEQFLEGDQIHSGEHPLSYHLSFDQEGCFHIRAYLFEEGDLDKKRSAHFGNWVYIEERGFYQVDMPLFRELHRLIPKEEMSEFIQNHRLWLSRFDGFQIHITGLDAHLTYRIDGEGLEFEGGGDFPDDSAEMVNFGEWFYVKGRGFYPKGTARSALSLRPGLKIPLDQIPSFIRGARDDLEIIPHFFARRSPLASVSLQIEVNQTGHIDVKPLYIYAQGVSPTSVQIFSGYTYTASEGFFPIPPEHTLPEPYSKPQQIEKKKEEAFLHYQLPELLPFTSSLDPRLKTPEKLTLCVEHIEPQGGGYAFRLVYKSQFGSVDAPVLWDAVQKRKNELITQAGLIPLSSPRFNWLRNLSSESVVGGNVQMNLIDWIQLDATESIDASEADLASQRWFKTFHEGSTTVSLELDGLKSTLRPYQKNGVYWLWFLYQYGLSGLLCDDMGLGKTHQAMALLCAVRNYNREKKRYLVVCPTSVLYHWQNLLQKFLPDMKVRFYYGLDRNLKGYGQGGEVLLTSYGTLRSEQKILSKLSFELVIFDEIQIAKNGGSQIHRVLKGLSARMKLGLSGTPIENRLLELKSLFDIILPNYFPSEAAFRDQFINPIEKHEDASKKALLRALVHPFILRRKKEEVLHDLPEKIEEVTLCALSSNQRELYSKAFYEQRDQILSELSEEGGIPYIHIFALFNRLKQICDHPALVEEPFAYDAHDSGKWELFTQLLSEALDSGRKVVIFTQYLGMLDLFKQYLEKQGIHYAEIRGSTRDRREQIEKFSTNPQCQVFIGTLQAAGVGIDLVAASVVIHYDRWWNPAKENQATDRVYRIGQNRGVQVFKLVTKDTIEEHIDRLIERKLALAQGIIGYDDEEQVKQFSREDFIQLFNQFEQLS